MTVHQLPISWPSRELHPSVRVNDPDTCVEPSEPRMSKGRTAALLAHAEHASGLTDFEVADLVGAQQTSAGKRRLELERAGLIVATTDRRESPSGALAVVWRITPAGVQLARQINEKETER